MALQIPTKIKDFFERLNSYGIPLPLLRIDGKATFTGTMTLLSFLTCLLGQIGKLTSFLGDINMTEANYLFLICLGSFLGHKVIDSGKSIEVDESDKDGTK